MTKKEIDGDEEYLKPKKFRNRKSKPKVDPVERNHPLHAPYKRDHRNLLLQHNKGEEWDDEDNSDN